MRQFDYKKYKTYCWDNGILNYLSQIHEYKGKLVKHGSGKDIFYSKKF